MTQQAETASRTRPVRTGNRRVRLSWLALTVVVCALASWVALSALLIVWPEGDQPRPVDVVVSLSGQDDDRLGVARELLARQPEAVLVVSMGRDDSVNAACAHPTDRVLCFQANPLRTSGEAQTIGRLAREHAWESVAVVTSTTHLTRARILIEQCVEGEVVMIDSGMWPEELRRRLLREWAGLVGAVTFDRAC